MNSQIAILKEFALARRNSSPVFAILGIQENDVRIASSILSPLSLVVSSVNLKIAATMVSALARSFYPRVCAISDTLDYDVKSNLSAFHLFNVPVMDSALAQLRISSVHAILDGLVPIANTFPVNAMSFIF